ncbi:MAG TPA: hypothetical protein VHE99_07600 [Gammaproteobacteria bacterium]|nr:hypothetical protein [Gammaproteobacteria bacterium]
MANILKNIEGVVYEPETSLNPMKINPLKNEIIDNIEELSKEINYLKDKVKILVTSKSDPEEVSDIIFKLRDLKESIKNRKQHWEEFISHLDVTLRQETLKAMDMLTSTTKNLESLLEQAQLSS